MWCARANFSCCAREALELDISGLHVLLPADPCLSSGPVGYVIGERLLAAETLMGRHRDEITGFCLKSFVLFSESLCNDDKTASHIVS